MYCGDEGGSLAALQTPIQGGLRLTARLIAP
jgi:hypothetical protein